MSSGNRTGPDFVSNLGLLLSVPLLANGVYCLSFPYVDFSIYWFGIIDFLLILILIPDPPILAVFFELATMATIPDIISSQYNYEDLKSLKFAANSIAETNAAILMHCYGMYYLGTWLARKRCTQTPADGPLTFPRLRTEMNAFLEIIILFSCNSALMIFVSALQHFQERYYLAVIGGLIMVLYSVLCLFLSEVRKHYYHRFAMMELMRKAVMAPRSQPTTGVAASDKERTVGLKLEQPVEEATKVESSV